MFSKKFLFALLLAWTLPTMASNTKIAKASVFVKDYDEAFKWYTEKLGFEGRDLGEFGPGLRWVTVNPKTQPDFELVLYKGDPITKGAILTLFTDDISAEYESLRKAGVVFTQAPSDRLYGIEAMFQDLYSQNIVLVQPKTREE